jgi:glutaredoxin-like protein
MSLLSEDDRTEVKQILDQLEEEVTVKVFTDDCETCEQTVELNRELEELSEKIRVETYDLDSPEAEEYDAARYDTGPVAVLVRGDISGVQYFGIPSGQEFSSYLQDLIAVSTGETDLDPQLKEDVKSIDEPVNIKVFVTPTCPHCPRAVMTAHQFAIENPNITAEMVEAQEFMELSQRFGVRGVPQVNINDDAGQFTGAQPPQQFFQAVKNAL